MSSGPLLLSSASRLSAHLAVSSSGTQFLVNQSPIEGRLRSMIYRFFQSCSVTPAPHVRQRKRKPHDYRSRFILRMVASSYSFQWPWMIRNNIRCEQRGVPQLFRRAISRIASDQLCDRGLSIGLVSSSVSPPNLHPRLRMVPLCCRIRRSLTDPYRFQTCPSLNPGLNAPPQHRC